MRPHDVGGIMAGHGRRVWVAAACLLAAVPASVAVLVPAATAATSPVPQLTASVNARGAVKVAWRISADARRDLQLTIDRGSSTSALTHWLTVNHPRPSAYRWDRRPLAGPGFYRVTLLAGTKVLGTSATVAVRPDATTTRASTSTTTSTTSTTTTTVPPGGGGACATARADILKLVNQARAANHVGPLADNTKLDSAAQYHSDWMATTGTFSHDGWLTEIANAGYQGGYLGQNIAAGQRTAVDVMSAWMGSTGHRANILNGSYRDLGVGCTIVNKGYGIYWTQDFGG